MPSQLQRPKDLIAKMPQPSPVKMPVPEPASLKKPTRVTPIPVPDTAIVKGEEKLGRAPVPHPGSPEHEAWKREQSTWKRAALAATEEGPPPGTFTKNVVGPKAAPPEAETTPMLEEVLPSSRH